MASQDVEQRFAHILRPIRDLASNWNIDLAQELEEYIEELEHVTVSFDGGQTSLNFAEAALVIQGSACVYSKKVEYLYTLIYQTLDHLAQQHKRAQRKTSVRADGTDADAAFDDEDGLLLLDDVITAGTNIDLVEDTGAGAGAGRRVSFGGGMFPDADRQAGRFTTPGNHVDSAGALTSKAPLSVMGSFAAQAAARGTSFNLSTCSVHESGALMLDANRRAMMELSADISHISIAGTPVGAAGDQAPGQQGDHAQDNEGGADAHAQAADDAPLMDWAGNEADDFDFDDNDNGGGFELANNGGAQAQEQPAAAAKTRRQVSFADPVDVWATHDPYDACPGSTRELKPGRTFKLPSDPRSIASGGVRTRAKSATSSCASFLNANATTKRSVSLLSPTPFFAALQPLYAAQKRRKRAEKRAQRLAGHAEYTPDNDDDDDDYDGGGGGFEVYEHDGVGDIDYPNDDFDMAGPDESDRPDARFAGEDGGPLPMNLNVDGLMDTSLTSGPTSYEELCRHHIAAFMRDADRFKEESGITRRVMDWQRRMEPILAHEETRPSFDIHEYGDHVLDTLEATVDGDGDAAEEEDDAPDPDVAMEGMDEEEDAGAPTRLVAFDRVVGGMPAEEVCRLFLATLQLANAGNVRLVHETSLPDNAAGHRLRMRLLNKAEPVDMESYRAPSAAAAGTGAEPVKLVMREPRKRPNKRRQREDDEAATDAGTDPSMDAENGPMAKVPRKSFKKAATRRGLGVNGTTLQRGARSAGTFLDLAAK